MQVTSDRYGLLETFPGGVTVRDNQRSVYVWNSPVYYLTQERFSRDKFSGPRPKRPEIRLTPMTLDRVTMSSFPMEQFWFPVTSYYSMCLEGYAGCLGSDEKCPPLNQGLPDPINLESTINKLLIEAHNKALQPDFDVPVFLAELKETLSMIRHPLRDILRFMQRRKSIKSIVEMTSSQWLKYRYGIRPLLSDLDAANKAVYWAKHRYCDIVRKSSAFKPIVASEVSGTSGFMPWTAIRMRTKTTVTDSYSITCSRYYNWSQNVYKPLLNMNVDVATVASVVWELIPYSFVADWFIGVGNWIASFRDDPRITHRGFTSTIVRRYSKSWVPTHVGYPDSRFPLHEITIDPGKHTWTIERKYRELASKPAWPVCDWGYRDILHVADGLTLIFQKLIGKRS